MGAKHGLFGFTLYIFARNLNFEHSNPLNITFPNSLFYQKPEIQENFHLTLENTYSVHCYAVKYHGRVRRFENMMYGCDMFYFRNILIFTLSFKKKTLLKKNVKYIGFERDNFT